MIRNSIIHIEKKDAGFVYRSDGNEEEVVVENVTTGPSVSTSRYAIFLNTSRTSQNNLSQTYFHIKIQLVKELLPGEGEQCLGYAN